MGEDFIGTGGRVGLRSRIRRAREDDAARAEEGRAEGRRRDQLSSSLRERIETFNWLDCELSRAGCGRIRPAWMT